MKKMENRGDLVRNRRRACGFTLRYLAEAAGVTENTLSCIERNEREASAQLLEKLAVILRMSPSDKDDLYLAFGKYPADVQSYLERNPRQVVTMIRKLAKLQEQKRYATDD